MPSDWSVVENNFPTLTQEKPLPKQIAEIWNYMALVTEHLKYSLNNLKSSNWNKTALKKLQGDTVRGIEGRLALLEGQIGAVSAKLDEITGRLCTLEAGLTVSDADEQGQREVVLGGAVKVSGSADGAKRIDLDGDVYINGIKTEGGTS